MLQRLGKSPHAKTLKHFEMAKDNKSRQRAPIAWRKKNWEIGGER